MQIKSLLVSLALTTIDSTNASPFYKRNATCQRTSVVILGAGTAGITAAQTLANNSVTDFLIVEYNSVIGGRVAHTTFGAPNQSYTVELGANWVQGLVTTGGPENPIWTLAQVYNLTNTYSNYSSIKTFNETGAVDYTDLLNDFETDYSTLEQDAGYILTENLQDRSTRSGLSLAGWKPGKDPQAQAIEWFEWDFEYAYTPEESSEEFGIVNFNTTFYQYSDANNYVFDSRGFNAFIVGEASTFLKPNDSRLLLNTVVTNVSYSDTGVTVYNKDGSCISADYAICTFSLGVLQSDAVTFSPEFPFWKQEGIETFSMGTYTKIFLQFPPDQVFWNTSYQFFLYADPDERGYYPLFQSLDASGFLPGSGIIFVTVTQDQSYVVEAQDDATTKAQVLEVLRNMFGAANVPDPIAFLYPRWSLEPWAYGSYSNWPPATSLEMHENLRANLGRLYFAGEATSTEYYGFLHGAWFEGQAVAEEILDCLAGNSSCTGEVHYEVLHGPTPTSDYDEANGWMVSSFLDYGF
ncbi:polyamine oxidase, partial [Lecanoromycetidae sp. Uapishka_2]